LKKFLKFFYELKHLRSVERVLYLIIKLHKYVWILQYSEISYPIISDEIL